MNLLFRADASASMGTGHVMRCLALAQAWQDAGCGAVFAMAEATPAIRERLSAEACEVVQISSPAGSAEDSRETIALAQGRHVEWIAVDGYQFTGQYQDVLRAGGFKVLALDDYGHAGHYSADLILNQNVSAREALYVHREPRTRLLLGPRYCLLRREFAGWREWRREVPLLGRKVLVTMGGSDPKSLTSCAVEALTQVKVEGIEGVIVVGGSTSGGRVSDYSAQFGNAIRVRKDVTNMAELMAWADVAVSSAGSTCWELCLLGLPALLVDVAENQTAVAKELDRRGCAIHVGGPQQFTAEHVTELLNRLLASHELRAATSSRSRELVDGKGAMRVVSAMRSGLRLRPARAADCRLLWEWANDPRVRETSFSPDSISWERHKIWFAGKMKDPKCHIFIAEDHAGKPVGQFRLDWRSNGEGEIGVSIAAAYRGTGHGSELIDAGVSAAFERKGQCLHAWIKPENRASRRAFEAAGFVNSGEEDMHGQRAIHYVRTRDQRPAMEGE